MDSVEYRIRRSEIRSRSGDQVYGLEAAEQSRDIEVYRVAARLGIKGDLGDDVGCRFGVFGLLTPVVLLVLPLLESNCCGVVNVPGTPTELGSVCSGFSKRYAQCEVIGRMRDEPHRSIAGPSQAHLVVRVHVLGIEEVPGKSG